MIALDGSRIDLGESEEWPLSIDLKVTGYCSHSCPFCHESSGPDGNHASPSEILTHLKGLPWWTEVAIGGGDPLSYPGLQEVVSGLGCIVNLTARDLDITPESLPTGITALGVSITEGVDPGETVKKIPEELRGSSVAHLILGITTPETYSEVKDHFKKILWLGFKNWGRNLGTPLPPLDQISRDITKDLYLEWDGILSFDNLALSQLDMKQKVLRSEWESFYLGPEFSTSMYVDAVEGIYAPYSTSPDRVKWNDISLKEYYVKNHKRTES